MVLLGGVLGGEERNNMNKTGLLCGTAMALVLTLTACSEEVEPKKGEANLEKKITKEDTTAYTAYNALVWLNESGLVSEEAEDVTEQFKTSKGLVRALRTDEAEIMEYEEEDNAKKYHNPDLNAYAVKNMYIMIKKGQDNADNFLKVLKAGKPITDLETSYSSEAQKKFVEEISIGSDFVKYANGFYDIPKETRSNTFDSFVIDKKVNWSGTIVDFLSDSVIVYGKPEEYNNENWETISSEKKVMMPYTFVAELKDKSQLNGLKQGELVAVKGIVASRGDKELQFNWKINKAEILK